MKTVNEFDLAEICKNLEGKLVGFELEEGNKLHRIIQADVEAYFGYEIEFKIYCEMLSDISIIIYDDDGETAHLPYLFEQEIENIIENYVSKYYNH